MSRKSNESLNDPTGAEPGKQGLSVAVSRHNGKGFIEPHTPRMEENLKLSSQIPPVAQISLEDANHVPLQTGAHPSLHAVHSFSVTSMVIMAGRSS